VRELNGLERVFNLRSYVRNHSFTVSEPSELGGPDRGPNPVEYVLSALGACYVIGFLILQRGMRGLEISRLLLKVNLITY